MVIDCTTLGSALYGKCSKILNNFHSLLSKKIWVIRAGIYKMLIRTANGEDPDQSASSEAVWSESALFCQRLLDWQVVFKILDH